jgi:hypothetical protein
MPITPAVVHSHPGILSWTQVFVGTRVPVLSLFDSCASFLGHPRGTPGGKQGLCEWLPVLLADFWSLRPFGVMLRPN